jgi:hypothetical protein
MQIHVRSFIRGARTTLPVVMAGGSALPRGPASVASRCRQIDVVMRCRMNGGELAEKSGQRHV